MKPVKTQQTFIKIKPGEDMETGAKLLRRGVDVSLIAEVSVTFAGGLVEWTPSLHVIVISLPETTESKRFEQLVLPVNNYISEQCI